MKKDPLEQRHRMATSLSKYRLTQMARTGGSSIDSNDTSSPNAVN